MEWVDWYNHTGLHSWCGDTPPAEYETLHYVRTPTRNSPRRQNRASTEPGAVHSVPPPSVSAFFGSGGNTVPYSGPRLGTARAGSAVGLLAALASCSGPGHVVGEGAGLEPVNEAALQLGRPLEPEATCADGPRVRDAA